MFVLNKRNDRYVLPSFYSVVPHPFPVSHSLGLSAWCFLVVSLKESYRSVVSFLSVASSLPNGRGQSVCLSISFNYFFPNAYSIGENLMSRFFRHLRKILFFSCCISETISSNHCVVYESCGCYIFITKVEGCFKNT